MREPRAVLVTGASTGIGEACVLRLARRGYTVFAGVRRLEDGERLHSKVAEISGRVWWLDLDVTRADQIAAAATTIAGALPDAGLAGLINNAGIAVGGPLEFVPIDQVRQQFEVNVIGLLAVTQAMLPLLRRARGRIVNIGSIAGKSVAPMVGPYGASKHAVEALTDGFRLELADAGIEVSVVEPGAVRTPIWDKGLAQLARVEGTLPPQARELYGSRLAFLGKAIEASARRGVPPEAVADVVVRALEDQRPRTRYVVGTDARIRAFLRWALPDRWNDAVLRAFLRRMERRLT
jgi:NAD(P)-dependent dehydrogenase (short-subunit alcohol dehydrogenase family)